MINQILKDDWYKTASKKEMRIALMHFEMNVMDRAVIKMSEAMKESRECVFDDAMSEIEVMEQ